MSSIFTGVDFVTVDVISPSTVRVTYKGQEEDQHGAGFSACKFTAKAAKSIKAEVSGGRGSSAWISTCDKILRKSPLRTP